MSDFAERIQTIARDLTHIEVNTIIKPNMTGRKMPKPRHAFIEIARKYSLKLMQLGYPVDENAIHMGGFESFDRIRSRANEGLQVLQGKAMRRELSEGEEMDMILFFRIKTMSDQIKGIFNALRRRGVREWDNDFSHEEIEEAPPPLPLTPDEMVMLRKIWEIGLEEIAMQTIIQMDGDVLTRVQPKYATPESAVIREIHGESLNLALRFWGELIGLVKDFFQNLFR